MGRFGSVLVAVAVAGSVCAAVQTPAGAVPAPEAGRFTQVSGQRTVAAGATAELRVACPAGTSVVGGGVDVEGGNTFTWIHASYPYDGPDGDTRPDDGWAGAIANGASNQRRMSTYATCAASGNFSYEQLRRSVVAGGEGVATPTCGSSSRVIGGGAQILRATRPPAVSLTGSYPVDTDSDGIDDDGWRVLVSHRYGTPVAVGFTAFAICESGVAAASLRYVRTVAKPTGGAAATPPVVAACPTTTTVVAGGTLLVSNRQDPARSIHSLFPIDGPDAGVAADDAWASRASVADVYFLNTFAVCSK